MSAAEVLHSILIGKGKLDSYYVRIHGNSDSFFESANIPLPSKLTPAELGLLRTVSWLYVHYNEIGKVNIAFLTEMLETLSIDSQANHKKHVKQVSELRTFFHHSLNLTVERNRKIQDNCEDWFEVCCGKREPEDENQWGTCLLTLLKDSDNYFRVLSRCIEAIYTSAEREFLVDQWRICRTRHHAPHEFDQIIGMVAGDMGRDNLDIVKFRKRNYESWITHFKQLTVYDFGEETRRLVEQALLTSRTILLPISGKDIIEHLGVTPGEQVGNHLARANELFNSNPRLGREELLAALVRQEQDMPTS